MGASLSYRTDRTRAWVAAAVLLAWLGGLSTSGADLWAQGEDLSDLISQYGIRSVEPPSQATDVILSRLEGGELALSDFYGEWVVLTFFATWCGPCVSEMPTLQRLFELLGQDGLAVVGVSIDVDRRPVEAFVERLGLSFPILWDGTGQAASLYRAESIPLSYLIDPRGRIVGVARGARDWAALSGLLDSLLVAVPPGREAPSDYVTAGGQVSLPTRLTPPTATVEVSESEPRVNDPFYLDVRIRWGGNFDEYLLHPPELELPAGVAKDGMSASTSSESGRNVVTYRLTLRGSEAGSYDLDPVELRYTPRFESTPVTSRVSGPTVHLQPYTVAGIAGLTPLALGAGAAVALVLTGVVVFLARRLQARRNLAPPAPGSLHDQLLPILEHARQARLAGDVASFLQGLARIEAHLGAAETQSKPRFVELGTWIEAARYGGRYPPTEELDRLERRFARWVAETKPDEAQVERESLQLAEKPIEPRP